MNAEHVPRAEASLVASLLAQPPRATLFRTLMRLLERAQDPALDEQVEHALNAWPEHLREVSRSWFKRAIKGKHRRTDHFARTLVLDKARNDDLGALAACSTLANIRHLTLKGDPGRSYQATLTSAALATLAHAPVMQELTQLNLHLNVENDDLTPLTTAPSTRLTSLNVVSTSAVGVDIKDIAFEGLEHLRAPLTPMALSTLGRSMCSTRLRSLDLMTPRKRSQAALIEALAVSTTFRALHTLHLTYHKLHVDEVARWRCSRAYPALQVLNLESGDGHADAYQALLSGPLCDPLRVLDLSHVALSTEHARALALCELPALQQLSLQARSVRPANASKRFDADAGRWLAQAPWLPRLKRLLINWHTEIGPALPDIIASAHALEVLDLDYCGAADDTIIQLAAQPHARHLVSLRLSNNPLTDAALIALIESSHLSNLRYLDLSSTAISARSIEVLAASEGLPSLQVLRLDNNRIGDRGARALASAPRSQDFEWISLYRAGIRKAGLASMTASRYLEGRFTGLTGFSAADRPISPDRPVLDLSLINLRHPDAE